MTSPHDDTRLDRIIAEGTRRRRRRHGMFGGGAATLAVLALVTAQLATDDHVDVATESDTTVADTSTTTDRSDQTTEQGSSTDRIGETTDAPASSSDTTTTSSTTSSTQTTDTALECRNSRNPECGSFRWDPPVDNQPITLDASVSKARVEVDEEFELHVLAEDPDARVRDVSERDVYYSEIENCGSPANGVFWADRDDPQSVRWVRPPSARSGRPMCSLPRCEEEQPHGPWDSPSPTAGDLERRFGHSYDSPGTYTIRVMVTSYTPDFDYSCAGPSDPYADGESATITIEVVEPEPDSNDDPIITVPGG